MLTASVRTVVWIVFGILTGASATVAQDAPTPEETTPRIESPEPIPVEQTVADEAIRTRLQALFDRIESLREVSVEVEAGIVRLKGRASTLEARQQAIELAKRIESVEFVETDLRVVTDLAERIDPALERLWEYATQAIAFLPLLGVALFLMIAFVVAGSWLARWNGPHLRFARNAFVAELVKQGIRIAFALIGVLLALELLNATALVGAVLGTAGVFGLALGFAFKDIVENHLAGVMLSLRQPFAPNDHLIIGSHEGKVVRLTSRETILMTLAGNHVRIPNAEVYKSVLTNYTRNPRRRFDFAVSVGTTDDLALAQSAGVEVLAKMVGVMDEPGPSAAITELGDSSVSLRFFGWVDQSRADFGRVRSEAIRLVKLALEAADVSMPSPEYIVNLQGESPAELGSDRPADRESAIASHARAELEKVDEERIDVSVDRSLDAQIAEDRRGSDETDLLAGSTDRPDESEA